MTPEQRRRQNGFEKPQSLSIYEFYAFIIARPRVFTRHPDHRILGAPYGLQHPDRIILPGKASDVAPSHEKTYACIPFLLAFSEGLPF